MLKFPTKVDNKLIFVAPILVGIYMAVMVPLSGVILAFISIKVGVSIVNDHPVLTGFSLFILSIPLAIFLNRLLLKRKQTYDEKLVAGLVSNVAFNLTITLILFLISSDLVLSFILFIVFGLFGFVIAALITVLIDKFETRYHISN